jgi:hypothetical protein
LGEGKRKETKVDTGDRQRLVDYENTTTMERNLETEPTFHSLQHIE